MSLGYLAYFNFLITKTSNFLAMLLGKVYAVKNFVRSDSAVMPDKACIPVVSVQSNTIFNEYRDLMCSHVYKILLRENVKSFIACADDGYVDCTVCVDNSVFSTRHVGRSAIVLSDAKMCVYTGKDLCTIAKSGRNDGYSAMVVCGSNICSNYEKYSSSDRGGGRKIFQGIRCKNFCEESKYTNKYIHKVDCDLSIIVIDACLGFANNAPYPFGILSCDIDRMLDGVDIVVIVGGNSKQIKDIEEIVLSLSDKVEIFCFNFNIVNICKDERYILFTNSTIFDSIKLYLSNMEAKVVDCISYRCNHRYGIKCIDTLLKKAEASKAKLLTMKCDYVLIMEAIQSKIDSYKSSANSVRNGEKYNIIMAKIQSLESLIDSAKKNIHVLDFSYEDNDMFTERVLHVAHALKSNKN